jgi:ADP-heptose:LPS heptosyltransferase
VKILAIRFARLGDVILLLPALAALKDQYPDSDLTLLTGHRCAPVAELCPAIDHVVAVDRVAMRDGPVWVALREMAALVRDVRQKKFDMVIDFHSFRETHLLTWFSGAPIRIGMKRDKAPYWKFCFNRPAVVEEKSLHVADMFRKVVAEALGEPAVIDRPYSKNTLGRLIAEKARQPTIALYVDAPVPERVWPPERFARVADFAVEKLNAAVVVLSGKDGAELAAKVQQTSRNASRLSVFTNLTLPQLAGVIASAQMLISNDTGPMHFGPTLGIRTLGLFSVGYPKHFRPMGPDDRFLQANPIERIEVENVIEVLEEMWVTADRDLLH